MQENAILMQAADLLLDAGIDYREAEDLLRSVLFRRALDRSAGNICHAAIAVGIHRNHFTRELDKLKLRHLPKQIRDSHRQEQLNLYGRKKSELARPRSRSAA
jgi:DNA-binding NtrC family response regulator